MGGNFFYKKLVTGGRNIGMEYARNAEGAADNACTEKNYPCRKGFCRKRSNYPEAKIYGESGKNRGCKAEKIGYLEFSYNDDRSGDYHSLKNIIERSESDDIRILRKPQMKSIGRRGNHRNAETCFCRKGNSQSYEKNCENIGNFFIKNTFFHKNPLKDKKCPRTFDIETPKAYAEHIAH